VTGARDPRRAPGRDVGRAVLVGAAAAALGAALVVRFVTTSPLWLDEALSVHIAELPYGDVAEALRHDGHPPLYYWLLHAWMSLVGDGDVAVRALSGILAVAALPLAWVAGRRVGGARTGWAAVAVLAWSPYAVRYATETRMYSLVTLLVFVGLLVVRRAVEERRAPLPRLVALAALTGALLVTQYWSMFLGAAVVLTLGWWARRRGPTARRVAVRLVAAMAAGGLVFLPWLPSFLEQAAHTGTPWAPAPRPTVVADLTLRDLGGGPIAEAGLYAALLVVLLLVGVLGRPTPAGLVLGNRPVPSVAGEAAVAALTLALGAVAGLATASTYASRYAAVVVPLVVVVVARGLAVIPGRRAPLVVGAALVALGAVGVVENVRTDRTQAGQLAARIAEGNEGGVIVVTCPDQLGPAMRRALDQSGVDHVDLYTYPDLGDGRRVDWVDYEERNDAADPAAVAADLLARTASTPDWPIWVAWNGSYRTYEGDCEAFLNALAAERGAFRVVEQDGADEFFEHAGLVVFG
jgi:uncharacterized membrane protein